MDEQSSNDNANMSVTALGNLTANQSTQVGSSLSQSLEPYVAAMQQASGLTREQAKTCVYDAVATHHIDKYDKFPQLVLQGSQGTGKTSAKEQLARMVSKPKNVTGRTEATIRDELNGATTALIDERENVAALEDLLTQRYARTTGQIAVNEQLPDNTYKPGNRNIFGATILCKRHPFRDGAMRSRAIVIHTKKKAAKYSLVDVPNMPQIAGQMNVGGVDPGQPTDRIYDTWKPLLDVARAVGDDEWLRYAYLEMEKERRLQGLSQTMEPTEALVHALSMLSEDMIIDVSRVKLRSVKETLRDEFDVNMNVQEIMDACEGLEIPVVSPKGYPQVKIDKKLIERLHQPMTKGGGTEGEKMGENR